MMVSAKKQLLRFNWRYCLKVLLLSFFLTVPWALAVPNIEVQENEEKLSTNVIYVQDQAELRTLFEVAYKIVFTPKLYDYLNEIFKDNLEISEALQKKFDWPKKTNKLSEPQIIFLLKNLPDKDEVLRLFNRYFKISEKSTQDESISNIDEIIEKLKVKFESILHKTETLKTLNELNDPSQSLTIQFQDGRKPGFNELSIHFNHDIYANGENDHDGLIPADDLKLEVKRAIKSAKTNIWINVYEWNLIELAQDVVDVFNTSLEAALKNNLGIDSVVKIRIGIDSKTIQNDSANIEVKNLFTSTEKNSRARVLELLKKTFPKMNPDELEEKASDFFQFAEVDATGINHQKIIAIDAGTDKALTLFSSGNLTQSCIGKEGDLVDLPDTIRPKQSIPNANHILKIRGALPSTLVVHELKKTIFKKIRGQKQYPISGLYHFMGRKMDGFKKPSRLGIAFSPNGGMGDVTNSILKPLVLKSKGEVSMMSFVASHPDLLNALIQLAKDYKDRFIFKFIGDPPFSVASWSIPLKMSAMTRNETTKKYSKDPSSPLNEIFNQTELDKLRTSIRTNTKKYGEFDFHIQMPNGQTQDRTATVKLHHKIIHFPRINLSIVGTSFNPSLSAESNQEQLAMVENHPINHLTAGAIAIEFDKANTTVTKRAFSKNRIGQTKPGEIPESDKDTENDKLSERRAKITDLESQQQFNEISLLNKKMCKKLYNP